MLKKHPLLLFITLSFIHFACNDNNSAKDVSSGQIVKHNVNKYTTKDTIAKQISDSTQAPEKKDTVISIKTANGRSVTAKAQITRNTSQSVTKKTATPKKKNVAKPKVRKKKRKPTPKKIAKIKFDKTEEDFGEITTGDKVKFVFEFTNVGNAPLDIVGATPSCGCSRPEIPFLSIMPGDKNKITIDYNSVSKVGPQTPYIIIKTNGEPSSVKLKLKGNVLPKEDDSKEEKKESSTATKNDTSEIKSAQKDTLTD